MIKHNVNVLGITPQMVLAYVIAQRLFNQHGYDCVITSATDGPHGRHSHHYKGHALDLRSRMIPESRRQAMAAALGAALGPQYQVILEADHIHIEFDPA